MNPDLRSQGTSFNFCSEINICDFDFYSYESFCRDENLKPILEAIMSCCLRYVSRCKKRLWIVQLNTFFAYKYLSKLKRAMNDFSRLLCYLKNLPLDFLWSYFFNA